MESELLQEIENYFTEYDESKQSLSVMSCQGDEPTEGDIQSFEEEIGFRLPDEFRQFTLSWLGGLYLTVKEELWPRPGIGDAGPAWSFLYGIKVFGISQNVPEWLDLRVRFREMRDSGFPGLVPFLQLEMDADCYCFDESGAIVKWRQDEPGLETCALSFPQVLLREIHELEERRDRKLNEAT